MENLTGLSGLGSGGDEEKMNDGGLESGLDLRLQTLEQRLGQREQNI